MDTQDNAGENESWGQLLRNANTEQREFMLFKETVWKWAVGYIAASAVNNLSEAIKKGDASKVDSILRCWGVRG